MKTNFFALLLTLVMCMTFSTTTFAEESAAPDISDPTAEVEKHTIEVKVQPGEEITEDDIMPLLWDEENISLMNGGTYDTIRFYVSDRYLAYETTVTGPHGEVITSGKFAVALMHNGGIKASMSGDPDGSTYKQDWIAMNPATYYFRAYNKTPAILNFKITYYTWN